MEALCLPASAVQRWCKQKHFNMRGPFEFYHVTKKIPIYGVVEYIFILLWIAVLGMCITLFILVSE